MSMPNDWLPRRARLASRRRAAFAPAPLLPYAALIVTATSSATPVIDDAVFPPTFIAAVGAYRPDMSELPPSLVQRARLFVDTLDGARDEAGDLLQAGVDWSTVTPLAAELERPDRGPVVFKSVGHALWDLAAALAARHAF